MLFEICAADGHFPADAARMRPSNQDIGYFNRGEQRYARAV